MMRISKRDCKEQAMNIFDELKWRGLVFQVSDEDGVREYLSTPGRAMYCGFDPSAKSLHIGNMVPLLGLLRFKRAGHSPIFLAGGATGLIGDPSGKDQERQLKPSEEIEFNISCIRKQAEKLFEGDVNIVNNHDWFGKITALEFLRDYGKFFSVNRMMGKESVKNRFGRDDVGISYTEFSYQILQSLDFEYLANEHSCKLQIGGSDQWGNITAGCEFMRRKSGLEGYAMTFPLITTADGKKFGKSEKGAIYLDPELTSVYEFYQFWVRADDRDVVKLLNYFTFLPQEEIAELAKCVEDQPHLREAQKRLAEEMTSLVHGKDELDKVLKATDALFGKGDIREVDVRTLKAALDEAPSQEYDKTDGLPDLAQMLVDTGLCASKGQAKKDIKAGGVYVNNERVQDIDFTPGASDFLHGEALMLRKGKKNYGLICLK